jgi:hypothetical protein
MSRKKPKKLYFMVFFDHLHTGRFTGFDTGLPVVPSGKPVIPTGIQVFCFSISKFQFGPVLTGFASFQGNQSYQWRSVFKEISVFQSLATALNVPAFHKPLPDLPNRRSSLST